MNEKVIDMEENWLRKSTGILAFGYGVYCFMLLLYFWSSGSSISPIIKLFCLIQGIIYLFFGAGLLLRTKGNYFFLAFVFVFGSSWWFSGLPWYIWPMVFMPIVILILSIFLFLSLFKGMKIDKFN